MIMGDKFDKKQQYNGKIISFYTLILFYLRPLIFSSHAIVAITVNEHESMNKQRFIGVIHLTHIHEILVCASLIFI